MQEQMFVKIIYKWKKKILIKDLADRKALNDFKMMNVYNNEDNTKPEWKEKSYWEG